MSRRSAYAFTVCVRDDDAKTFAFHRVADATDLMNRVAATVAAGRRVRGYTLASDELAQEREEKYLVGKGYRQSAVPL
jgi:hypothetical protein